MQFSNHWVCNMKSKNHNLNQRTNLFSTGQTFIRKINDDTITRIPTIKIIFKKCTDFLSPAFIPS